MDNNKQRFFTKNINNNTKVNKMHNAPARVQTAVAVKLRPHVLQLWKMLATFEE